MILSTVLVIALVFAAALLISAALSPLETLSWWAGWNEEEISPARASSIVTTPSGTQTKHYIVYLSGICLLYTSDAADE